MSDDTVSPELVGDAWPAAEPGNDPVLYGHVSLEPRGEFEARSVQTFRLTYTVGRFGMSPPAPAPVPACRWPTPGPATSAPGSVR